MIAWLQDVTEVGLDVVEAQAKVIEQQGRRLGVLLAWFVVLGCAGGAAICGLLAGIVVFLTPLLGIGGALVLIGALVSAAVCAVLALAYQRATRAMKVAQTYAATARSAMGDLMSPEEKSEDTTDQDESQSGLLHDALGLVMSKPSLVSSAAFAALSILGPRRAFGLVRAAAAVASAKAVASQMASEFGGSGESTRNGRVHARTGQSKPYGAHV